MKFWLANTLPILGALLLWVPLSANAVIYSAEAIEGWVVDSETGKPTEGVIVVAHWQLKGGFEGGNPVGELKILEAVTDKNGRYSFPAWGPRFALMGHLKSESPEILMFKQGYKFRYLNNNWYSGMDTSKSVWNGKTVKLDRFISNLHVYSDDLRSLTSTLWIVGYTSGDRCAWKAFPNMLRELDKLESEFRRGGIVRGTIVSDLRANDSQLRAAGCGSVDDLIKR